MRLSIRSPLRYTDKVEIKKVSSQTEIPLSRDLRADAPTPTHGQSRESLRMEIQLPSGIETIQLSLTKNLVHGYGHKRTIDILTSTWNLIPVFDTSTQYL